MYSKQKIVLVLKILIITNRTAYSYTALQIESNSGVFLAEKINNNNVP